MWSARWVDTEDTETAVEDELGFAALLGRNAEVAPAGLYQRGIADVDSRQLEDHVAGTLVALAAEGMMSCDQDTAEVGSSLVEQCAALDKPD